MIAFDLASAEPARFRELIGPRVDAVIEGISAAADRIVVEYLARARSRVEVFDREGKALGGLELPGIGSASVVTHPDRAVAWLAFESFAEPTGIYRVDLAARTTTLWRRPSLPAGGPAIEVEQVTVTSRDGTQLPMFLVHRRDLELDGQRHPAVLYGVRRVRYLLDAGVHGAVVALDRARRRLCGRESARRRRVRRGLASRRHARAQAERLRRFLRGGRVARREGLHEPRAARHSRPLERRAC